MAVPFVVAALAAACEAGNCAGVLSRFQETAEDLGPPGIDPIFGHGLIRPWLATQARAAVPAP
ncbi:MAG: hypothetical protein D6782_12110 [Alphaproteobacteria bacterium]|nr:MAG: hypothetical protein D6782_12110 [Alphaproteobacteria bacterium]